MEKYKRDNFEIVRVTHWREGIKIHFGNIINGNSLRGSIILNIDLK